METASRQLHAKFEIAKLLLDKIPLAGVSMQMVNTLVMTLSNLESKFAISTGYLYIISSSGESGRIKANAEFARVLAMEDFAGIIDRLVKKCEDILRNTGIILRDDNNETPKKGKNATNVSKIRSNSKHLLLICADIQRLIDIYPYGNYNCDMLNPAAGAALHVDYEHCSTCGGDMAVDANRSELRCSDPECGAICELAGTVFDDSQFYSQEGQKAKSGAFNPNRHFQFWWMHILAREPEEEIGDKDDPDNLYGEKILAEIRAIVIRDRKVLRMLSVNDIRLMLREIGRTDLNKNVPLILKKITGVGPPQIIDTIAVRVENLFTKAIEASERIQRTGRINRNYYPYYIYKILDNILPVNDFENRMVLYYIYIQSKETVEADDADWEQICLELTEIVYTPTDRTQSLKYHQT